MARVAKRPQAEDDLLEIFVQIGQNSTRAAQRFLEAFDRAANRLAAMPQMGGTCESDHPMLAELRVWSIKGFPKYLIFYRPLEDGIEVVRVVLGSRDLESLFDA